MRRCAAALAALAPGAGWAGGVGQLWAAPLSLEAVVHDEGADHNLDLILHAPPPPLIRPRQQRVELACGAGDQKERGSSRQQQPAKREMSMQAMQAR